MKLLFCKKCLDVFSIRIDREKSCGCGATKGQYTDDLNAVFSGDDAVPIGFSNPSFTEALRKQPESGMGKEFLSFVIPKECDTFKKV